MTVPGFKSKFMTLLRVGKLPCKTQAKWMRTPSANDSASSWHHVICRPLGPAPALPAYAGHCQALWLASHKRQDAAASAFGSKLGVSGLAPTVCLLSQIIAMVPPLPRSPGKHKATLFVSDSTRKHVGLEASLLALKDVAKLLKGCRELFRPRAKAGGTDCAQV